MYMSGDKILMLRLKSCVPTSEEVEKSGSTVRWKNGYLHSESKFHMNPLYYQKAKSARNIMDHEFFYQRVFHEETYATLVSKEVFQRKTRQNIRLRNTTGIICTNDNEIVSNVGGSRVVKNSSLSYSCRCGRLKGSNNSDQFCTSCRSSVKPLNLVGNSTQFVSPNETSLENHNEDIRYWFLTAITDISRKLNDKQLKVFAFTIVKIDLDKYINMDLIDKINPRLHSVLKEIWSFDKLRVRNLYDYVGTRYSTDTARYEVKKIIEESGLLGDLFND